MTVGLVGTAVVPAPPAAVAAAVFDGCDAEADEGTAAVAVGAVEAVVAAADVDRGMALSFEGCCGSDDLDPEDPEAPPPPEEVDDACTFFDAAGGGLTSPEEAAGAPLPPPPPTDASRGRFPLLPPAGPPDVVAEGGKVGEEAGFGPPPAPDAPVGLGWVGGRPLPRPAPPPPALDFPPPVPAATAAVTAVEAFRCAIPPAGCPPAGRTVPTLDPGFGAVSEDWSVFVF